MFEEYGKVIGMITDSYGWLYSITLLCDVSKTPSYLKDKMLYGRPADIPVCWTEADFIRWVYFVFDERVGMYIRLIRELNEDEKREVFRRMLKGEKSVNILDDMGLLYEDEA